VAGKIETADSVSGGPSGSKVVSHWQASLDDLKTRQTSLDDLKTRQTSLDDLKTSLDDLKTH
jgi:hypothetical protein